MIKTGAILLAFLAFASAAKAENVIYTGSRDIVVDLSVLGADEEIKLQTEEVFLPAPVVPEEPKASAESKITAEPKASAKPEKIILKKPPFTYKKPFKARKPKTPSTVPAAASAPAPVTKTKKEAKKEAKQDAQTQAIAEAKKEIKSEAKKEVKSEAKKETKKETIAEVRTKATDKPSAKPAEKKAPVPAEAPALTEAPAPLAAPTLAVEKGDIDDIITKSGHVIFFDFAPSATGLTAQNKADLKEIANTVKADNRLAIRLIAYAKNPEFASSKARRTSLSRALTIRDFLLKEGIPSSKIEVHALGNRVQKDQVFLEILAEE